MIFVPTLVGWKKVDRTVHLSLREVREAKK